MANIAILWICDCGGVWLGEAPKQLDLLDPVTRFCDESLAASSIYGFLFRERDRLSRTSCSRTCSR